MIVAVIVIVAAVSVAVAVSAAMKNVMIDAMKTVVNIVKKNAADAAVVNANMNTEKNFVVRPDAEKNEAMTITMERKIAVVNGLNQQKSAKLGNKKAGS